MILYKAIRIIILDECLNILFNNIKRNVIDKGNIPNLKCPRCKKQYLMVNIAMLAETPSDPEYDHVERVDLRCPDKRCGYFGDLELNALGSTTYEDYFEIYEYAKDQYREECHAGMWDDPDQKLDEEDDPL